MAASFGAGATAAHASVHVDRDHNKVFDDLQAGLTGATPRRCTIAHALLHFWCAKEAAWKARGGALPTLKRVPLRLVAESARGLQFDEAETYAVDDVVVALSS